MYACGRRNEPDYTKADRFRMLAQTFSSVSASPSVVSTFKWRVGRSQITNCFLHQPRSGQYHIGILPRFFEALFYLLSPFEPVFSILPIEKATNLQ